MQRGIGSIVVIALAFVIFAGCALPAPPSAPTPSPPSTDAVAASDGDFNDRIRLSWEAEPLAVEYRVSRALSADGDFLTLAITGERSFDDPRVAAGAAVLDYKTAYYYKVEARLGDDSYVSVGVDPGWVDDFVDIPDGYVRRAMAAQIPGKRPADKIYAAELAPITALSVRPDLIAHRLDLEGIQHCRSLGDLYVEYGGIDDLSPLSACTTLKVLIFYRTKLSDLHGLEGLSLEDLRLTGNDLADLGPLRGMASLTELLVWENPGVDISALATLVNLERLNLGHVAAIGADDCAGLKKLKDLVISHCPALDVSLMNDFPDLERVWLLQNVVTDLSGFNNCPRLAAVECSENDLRIVSGLAGCPLLKRIMISHSFIRDVSWVARCPAVEILYLDDNEIALTGDFSGAALKNLNLSGNDITHLPALSCAGLEEIDVHSNRLENLDFLAALPNLRSVSAPYNRIADISALRGNTTLKQLFLEHNAVSDITPLENLDGAVVNVILNNMDIRPGTANCATVWRLLAAGCSVNYREGNLTNEDTLDLVRETGRRAFSGVFGSRYRPFSHTDTTFAHGSYIHYGASAEYAGAIAGATQEVAYAGVVDAPPDAALLSIDEFVSRAASLPLIDQAMTPNPALVYAQEFREIAGRRVWCEAADAGDEERRLYLFKYDTVFVIVVYYCRPRGLQVLAEDVQPAVERIIGELFP